MFETMSKESVTSERRLANRSAVRCPARVRLPGLVPIAGRLVNLSTHGVLVAVPSELPLGSEVRIALDLPDGAGPLEIGALVVRQDRADSSGGPVEVALCFMHPSPDVVRRLSELVWRP